jgi:amino acid adenylation domain-containing protein
MSRREGVTLFMLMLAAFKVLLHRYTHQPDIVVGVPVAGRPRAELEGLIGFFVNTVVTRSEIRAGMSFEEVMRREKQEVKRALEHEEVPFEMLVEELQPHRSLSYSPLFQVAFNFLSAAAQELSLRGLSLSPVEFEIGTSKYDLVLAVVESGPTLLIDMRYSTDLFDETTIAKMLDHFRVLLEGAVANPAQSISRLPLLTAADKRRLLVERNDEKRPFATDPLIHQLVEQRADRTPDAAAAVCNGAHLSYGELNVRANRLAHYLRALGVEPDARVAICVERSLDMLVGLLAVLKAGGAYVPLDPAYPAERLGHMLEDSAPLAVLTHAELDADIRATLAAAGAPLIDVGEVGRWQSAPATNPDPARVGVKPDHVAYVIYTSGSTGKPKGVMVEHGNVARLYSATQAWFDFDSSDVWTLFHSFAFDFSVWEIFGALLYGGRLIVVPHLTSRSPQEFYRLLCREGVTILNQTPSAFRQLIAAQAESVEAHRLRLTIFGGEALEVASLKPWYDNAMNLHTRLINMYGITETTVHVTYRSLEPADAERAGSSPIGSPIPDLRVYLLDRHNEPVPRGVAGEMHVGGDGVARGYMNRPDLTAERFLPDPFTYKPGARIYKTGDLGRQLADGGIEYLGRNDFQVKIRGFRIELGEIEAALARYPGLVDSTVIARDDMPGGSRLVAYLVYDTDQSPNIGELRAYLKEKLPEYMMPSAFVLLDSLPLTPNGKLDRRALPLPDQARPEPSRAYVEPRNELERMLARKWQEVLGVDEISVHDNFFDIGGESLKAAILINNVQQELGEMLQVVTLFDAPTIADFAAYLTRHCPDVVARLSRGESDDYAKEAGAGATSTRKVDAERLEQMRRLIVPLTPRQPQHISATKNPRAIFILSPPRSGSTLLRVMLAGHPKLFAPPELELLGFYSMLDRRAAFSGRDSFWLEGAIRAVMQARGVSAQQAREIIEECEHSGMSTKEFYGLMQGWLEGRMLVDKTPSYAMDEEILKRAEADFEDALYIHLLRSPQGTIRSYEEAKLDQLFPRFKHPFQARELAEMVWAISHQNIVSFLQQVPTHRQHRVRFEELVSDPDQCAEAICRFLGIEFHTDMLEPYKDEERRMTRGIHKASRMLGDIKFHQHTTIDPAVAESWRGYFTDDFLGDVTWQLAESLGYSRQAASAPSRRQALSPIRQAVADRGIEQMLTEIGHFSDEQVDSLLSEMLNEIQDNR